MDSSVLDAAGARFATHLRETGRALVAGLRRHALLYALAISIELAALVAAFSVNSLQNTQMLLLFSPLFLILLCASVLWRVACEIYRLWRTNYEGSPIKVVAEIIANDVLAPQRVANFLHACMALSLFMSAFTSLKSHLPKLNPFKWDVAFAEWDQALHFGLHPYQILQPIFGHPYVSTAVNIGYNMWFFVLISSLIGVAAMRRDSAIRQRYLAAVMITWFVGTNVVGTFLSSAGPAFYGRLLGGQDPYLSLMTYLERASEISPVWALKAQDMLWESYVTGEGAINGISAMPSMHVGQCILLVLVFFAVGRTWIGWLAVCFTVVIFLGSIHLAWHYAIDGYAGALMGLFGWYLAGLLVRWDWKRQRLVSA